MKVYVVIELPPKEENEEFVYGEIMGIYSTLALAEELKERLEKKEQKECEENGFNNPIRYELEEHELDTYRYER